MWKIRCSDVPSFLRDGSFFQNLDLEDQDTFEVPEDSFKPDLVIDSERDLSLLLRTVQFWGLPEIPIEMASYVLRTGDVADYEYLLEAFPDLTPYFNKILQVKRVRFCDGITAAIKLELGVRMVRLLHQLDYVLCGECCEAAATAGDLEILMYLHTEGCPWDERTTTAAATHSHLSCLEYAPDFNRARVPDIMKIAAQKGSTASMKCLQNCLIPLTDDALTPCLRGGKLDNLRYLVESGCNIPDDVCMYATILSNRECLAFLHQRGFSLTPLCSLFASNGRLTMLQYLHQHGCLWNARCCAMAAEGDHLDCLQYLHENGCPWDESTIAAAMARRSWKCLWYALRHGCPGLFLLRLGLGVFIVAGYAHSFLQNGLTGEWNKIQMLQVGTFLMSSASLLTLLNETFGAYYAEYIAPETGARISSLFSLISVLFGIYFLVRTFFTSSSA